jgi:hypothetical protein
VKKRPYCKLILETLCCNEDSTCKGMTTSDGDGAFGIHSCVWDGGLTLIFYFSQYGVVELVCRVGIGKQWCNASRHDWSAGSNIHCCQKNVKLNLFSNTILAVHKLTYMGRIGAATIYSHDTISL